MKVSEERFLKGVLITLAGHMDSVHSPAALAELEKITETPAALFAFDCNQLTYVSSAGLRVFLQIAKKVKSLHRAKVGLICQNPMVREVFEIAGFEAMFRICNSRAELGLT